MNTVEELLASLSPQARRELLAKLDGPAPAAPPTSSPQPAAPAQPPAAPADPASRSAPLSFGQRRLWFLHQLNPGDTAYHIAYLVDWPAGTDPDIMAAALEDLVNRHEALRTCFPAEHGEPRQSVPAKVEVPLRRVHLPGDDESAVENWARKAAREPFDLERGPLLRAWWAARDQQTATMVLVVHHIVFDGWSMQVLLSDLAAFYDARATGAAQPTPLAAQYADFTRWQRQLLGRGVREEQAAYWRTRLGDGFEPLEIPTDHSRGRSTEHLGTTFRFTLPDQLRDGLTALARDRDATVYMVVLAGFLAMLHRYTGRDDISVGTPVTNRDLPEFERLIGFFLNTVVLRVDLSADPGFGELLDRVRLATLDAHDHRDLPFEAVVEEIAPRRAAGALPLAPVLFAYNARPSARTSSSNSLGSPAYREIDTGGSRAELTVVFEETPEGLHGSIEYDTALFDPDTSRRMAGHLCRLLEGVVADPGCALSELPLLTDPELVQLAAWNATGVTGAPGVLDEGPALDALDAPPLLVPDMMRRQAARTPDARAVVSGEETLTYRDLDARADRLAARLLALGVQPGEPVGLVLDRCADLVVALAGIIRSGAAYLPLDPALPADRLEFILTDAHVGTLLTHTDLLDRLGDAKANVIELDAPDLDAGEPGSASPAASISTPPITPGQTAYVIYTSGSTGRPKGVVNTHAGLANHMLWMLDKYRPDEHDVVLQKTPAGFDVSLWEFLLPLISGGLLVMTPPEGHRDSALLVDLVERHQITMIHFVPSMLHAFLSTISAADLARCASVRQVLCSGEALPVDLCQRYFASGLSAPIDNLYGPTEAAIHVTHWSCAPGEATVPIGHPIRNTQTHVVDRYGRALPVGVPGELWLGGVQVAAGYLGRPDLTAERFTPDPFRTDPDATVFRTGDLVRRSTDGSLEFLGRLDHQVKLRGYRIELGEVEAALLTHDQVAEAVVLLRTDGPSGPRLAAYFTPNGDAPPPSDLGAHLRRVLPGYMVPASYTSLPRMPLSANGKIDRRAVAAVAPDAQAAAARYVAPRDELETAVTGLFTEVLGGQRIGVDDDFFELGGHSLLAARLVALVHRDFAVDLALRELFDGPTVSAVAAHITGAVRAHPNQTGRKDTDAEG